MTPARLLVVEDDPTLGLSLQLALSAEGYDVTTVGTLAAARTAIDTSAFDLVLLDLGLPDGDGLELCAAMRQERNFAPIIALTARATIEARVEGLGAGADDYVTKPFDLPELLARIAARLRRRQWPKASLRLELGRLRVDFAARQATCDGEPVSLSELELRLLRFLHEREGTVVSREQLLTDVWELPATSKTRTIDTFVYRLRKFIEPDPRVPKHLLSARGAGYRLIL